MNTQNDELSKAIVFIFAAAFIVFFILSRGG